MKCPIPEKQIYLFCDNLLDEKNAALARDHIASCESCKHTFEEARKSLRVLSQPASENGMLTDEIAEGVIDGLFIENDSDKRAAPRRIFQFPKIGYGIAAATVVAFAIGLSTPLMLRAFHVIGHVDATVSAGNQKSAPTVSDSTVTTLDKAIETPYRKHTTAQTRETDYAAIRLMIRQGKYDSAIVAIPKYLAKHSATDNADMAYSDLALCYCRTNKWVDALDAFAKASATTADSLVREAALHRTNSILFTELARIDQAETGINTYLEKYPKGTWRELEYILLVRVKIAEKKHKEAIATLKQFKLEFPQSRIAVNLHNEIKQMGKAQTAGR